MTENGKGSGGTWIDPDDLREWTDEMFERADLYGGDRLIRRGRPKSDAPKVPINIRLSPDVLERFKASGPGWQTRIDAALRDFIEEHPDRV